MFRLRQIGAPQGASLAACTCLAAVTGCSPSDSAAPAPVDDATNWTAEASSPEVGDVRAVVVARATTPSEGGDDVSKRAAAPDADASVAHPSSAEVDGGDGSDASPADRVAPEASSVDAGPDSAPWSMDASAPLGPACPHPSLSVCAGNCVDLQADDVNCGACGYQCSTSVPRATASCKGGSCKVTCGGTLSLCRGGANAQCVDLTLDARNCGACGHDCGPGACTGGQCQPWLVASQLDASSIASDGAYVAWYDPSTVSCYFVPAGVTGASPLKFAAAPGVIGSPGFVAFSAGTLGCLARVDASSHGIWLAPEGSSSASIPVPVLLSSDPRGFAFSSDHAKAYVAGGGSNGPLFECPFGSPSNSCATLSSRGAVNGGLANLAIGANFAFWAEGVDGIIQRVSLDDQQTSALALGGPVVSVTSDGTNVYWTSMTDTTFSVRWSSIDLSRAGSLVADRAGSAEAIATDGSDVYFGADISNSISIQRISVNPNSATVPVVIYQPTATVLYGIAVGGGMLYWSQDSAIYGIRVP